MERNNAQNHPNRAVDEDHLDLTLRLGVGDSRTTPARSLNQQNSELGYPVMEWSGSNSSAGASSNTVALNPMAVDQTVSDNRGYDEMPLQRTEHLNLPETNADDEPEHADEDEFVSAISDFMERGINNMSYEDLLDVAQQLGIVSTGLSKDTIDACLVRYFYPLFRLGPRTCCICQEDFTEGSLVGFLECMHDSFHFCCIKEWLLRKNECPLCRSVAIRLYYP